MEKHWEQAAVLAEVSLYVKVSVLLKETPAVNCECLQKASDGWGKGGMWGKKEISHNTQAAIIHVEFLK